MVPEDPLPPNPAICMVFQQYQQCYGAAIRMGLNAVFIGLGYGIKTDREHLG